MTDRPAGRLLRPPSLRAVGAASLAAFAVVFALLVAQMRLGRDPALGAGRAAAPAATLPAQRVLVRRVIVTRIVVDEIHDVDGGGATAPARTTAVVPQRTAAPVPAAVVPAPARAPAPAPLVTKTS